jgi:hypothetical protein
MPRVMHPLLEGVPGTHSDDWRGKCICLSLLDSALDNLTSSVLSCPEDKCRLRLSFIQLGRASRQRTERLSDFTIFVRCTSDGLQQAPVLLALLALDMCLSCWGDLSVFGTEICGRQLSDIQKVISMENSLVIGGYMDSSA